MTLYTCLNLTCDEPTGSRLLLYCPKHSNSVEEEVLFGKEAVVKQGADL